MHPELPNRINARNRSVIWALGAESLDAMERATFNLRRPDVILLQATGPCEDGAMYSIAECVEALRSSEYRALCQWHEAPPDRADFVALYHGPTRSGSFESFICQRADVAYWDPFSPDDGWPGYDDYTSKVSPMFVVYDTEHKCTLMRTQLFAQIR